MSEAEVTRRDREMAERAGLSTASTEEIERAEWQMGAVPRALREQWLSTGVSAPGFVKFERIARAIAQARAEGATSERNKLMGKMGKNMAMPEYPKELVEAARDAYRRCNGNNYESMQAALEAADKWRAVQASTQASAEVSGNEPIGVPVTAITALRVGDRVSFLAEDQTTADETIRRFTGVLQIFEDGCARVLCDGHSPDGDTGERAWFLVDASPMEDLRLVSRAPVETTPEAKASAADAHVPANFAALQDIAEEAAVKYLTGQRSTSEDPTPRGVAKFVLSRLCAAGAFPAPSVADAQVPGLLKEVAELRAACGEWKTRTETAEAKVLELREEVARLTREVNERCREIGILREDDTAVRDRAQTIVDECMGPHEAMPMDALLTIIECALRERGEWKARAVDARVQFVEARAAIGEKWFYGNASLVEAIRRKWVLERAAEMAREKKVPAEPYEEDAELVEACCRVFLETFVRGDTQTKDEVRSEVRVLLRTVREYHQSRAKAQAVAEPEPKVEQAAGTELAHLVRREEVDALASALRAMLTAAGYVGPEDAGRVGKYGAILRIAEARLREYVEARHKQKP